MSVRVLEMQPVTTAIGSHVNGIDLREPLDASTVQVLRETVAERGVLFSEGQDLTDEQMRMFAANFGEPVPDPAVGYDDRPAVGAADFRVGQKGTSVWHFDTAFVPNPPSLTILRAVSLPPVGGDTCWANAQTAYDALPEPIHTLLDALSALRSTAPSRARLGADRPSGSAVLPSGTTAPSSTSQYPTTTRHGSCNGS
jgi:taurine dioxygenase